MGHDLSKQANRLSIAAVSHITQFDRDDLLELRSAFERTTAGKPSPVKKPSVSGKERVEPNLSREEFNAALESVDFHDSDRAIFDRLFTMLDKTGDDVINSREFLVGVAPLVKGNLSSKIALALEMYDEDSTGEITSAGLRFIVTTVTTMATFFGDPPMTKKDVVALSNAIMDGRDSIEYTKNIPRLAQHPIVQAYIAQEEE